MIECFEIIKEPGDLKTRSPEWANAANDDTNEMTPLFTLGSFCAKGFILSVNKRRLTINDMDRPKLLDSSVVIH